MSCKNIEEKRKYAREWTKARRMSFFSGKKCKECGTTENLQLHHIDPKKKESHRIWSWSKKRREKEIAKCVVLCHDCHVNAHTRVQVTHGTASCYRHGKCRCSLCREANTIAVREMRRRKKERDNLM